MLHNYETAPIYCDLLHCRLLRELVDLEKPGTRKILAENGIRMFPGEIDITRWIVEIQGPPETPYEGARFYLSFEAGPNYP